MEEINSKTNNKILILALGNEIMGDDGAGMKVLSMLEDNYKEKADSVKLYSAGFNLLDVIEGYEKLLILDTINTENGNIGEIYEIEPSYFKTHFNSSSHYAGLPEIINIAQKLELNIPKEIKILAINIKSNNLLYEGLSEEIEKKLPHLKIKAENIINNWLN